jgi:L-ribulokinase
VINGGGIPQRSQTLNRVYANALNKPVLVPKSDVTSLGSAIFAFLAAGAFSSIEEAQDALCPSYSTIEPEAASAAIYQQLYPLYRGLYFALGGKQEAMSMGAVLPSLRRIAAQARGAAA